MGKHQSFEDHYDLIKQLYVVENKTLPEVMDIMKKKGFDKSKRAYERWFSNWDFRKNVDWKNSGGVVEKRQAEGKQSVIKVNPFKRRDKEWVRKSSSRRFVSALERFEKNKSLVGGVSSSERTALSSGMVIRSPSPVFTGLVQEYRIIPSPWYHLQDLLQTMGIQVSARAATPSGVSLSGSPGIMANWDRLDNRHLLRLFPRTEDISNYSTYQLVRWTEMKIRSVVPERHPNEHRQLAELVCTKMGPDTIHYCMLQLFQLANNFTGIGRYGSGFKDSEVIDLVKAMESKWKDKLKSLLELDNWVIRATKEKVFSSALREGKPEIIHVILEAGFDPNRVVADPSEYRYERPAIYVAVGLKDENMALRIVQLLITCKHGVKMDAQSRALHRALSRGRNAAAKVFLDAGVPLHMPSLVEAMNSNYRFQSWDNAQHAGLETWNMIKSLVASGASSRVDLLSALELAINTQDPRIISDLLDIIVCGTDGLTSADVGKAFQVVAPNAFIKALEGDYVDIVRQTIDARPDLLDSSIWIGSYPYRNRRTALGVAVEFGHFDLANLLISRGANVSSLNQELDVDNEPILRHTVLTTPLGLAALGGNVGMVQLLIQNGATSAHAFPLLAACWKGHAEIAMALLKSGFEAKQGDTYANANTLRVPDKAFAAPHSLKNLLSYRSCVGAFSACLHGQNCFHQELLGHLIQKGARTDEGFLVAIKCGNLPLLELLLPHVKSTPFTWDEFEKTPLGFAVENGPLTIVKFLVDAGFTQVRNVQRIYSSDVALFLEQGKSPLLPGILKGRNGTQILTDAISRKNRDLAEHLLRYDIGLNQPVHDWWKLSSPLEAAVGIGDVDLISVLLSRKALITAKLWITFSSIPESSDTEKLLKVLLTSLAQDTRHKRPETAFLVNNKLMIDAVRARNHTFVNLLLEVPTWDAKYLGKALTLAAHLNQDRLVQVFLNAGASLEEDLDRLAGEGPVNSALQAAVGKRNSNMVRALLSAGRAINARIGYEALCRGIQWEGDLKIIRILLEAGTDPNYRRTCSQMRNDIDGPTVLQVAAYWESFPVISLLIEHGADVNAPPSNDADETGAATALQYAAINGHLQMAELLLKHGADVNAPAANYNGRTALEGAAENGRLEMVRFLFTIEPKLEFRGVYRINFLRAVKLASDKGHKEVAEFLKLHGGWSESDERETDVNPQIVNAGDDGEWTGPGDEPKESWSEGESEAEGESEGEENNEETDEVQPDDEIQNSYQEVPIADQEESELQVFSELAAFTEAVQEDVDLNQGQSFQQAVSWHDIESEGLGNFMDFLLGYEDGHGDYDGNMDLD
ncbi:hypothetical protein QBC43DRAFT_351939 [Cladorrhinum sp. PSN259]|nr:hypothetical protein QBC43DRAFT_351939 [Cladorrhinum sp. PSN259]